MRQLHPHPADIVDLEVAYPCLAPLGPLRPSVRVNMIASLDGATAVNGRSGALGGAADKSVFASLRAAADVVLVGANTMRAERYGPARLDPAVQSQRAARGQTPVPAIAVVTASCQLDWDSAFFTDAAVRPLILTVEHAAATDRERAAHVADVIIAGEHHVEPEPAMTALARGGADNILVEGGPRLNGQLASAGLIDEVCLTLAPRLVSGDAARILHGPALELAADLELAHVLEADQYLFFRYSRR